MSYQNREFRYIKGKQEGWNETECADFLGLSRERQNQIINFLYETKYRGRTPDFQTLKKRLFNYCNTKVEEAKARKANAEEARKANAKEEAKARREAEAKARREALQAAQKKEADKKVKLKENLGAFLENSSVTQLIDQINEFDINYKSPKPSNPTLELNRPNCIRFMRDLKDVFVNELTKLIFNDYKSGKINKEHAIKLLVDVINRANKDADQIREECLTAKSETLYFKNIKDSSYKQEAEAREAEAREAEAMRQAREAMRQVTKKTPGRIDLEGLKLIDNALTRRLYKIKGNLGHDEFDLGKLPDGRYILTDRKNESVQVLKGGKRKTQKRKTQKRKTQKRKTQKRKTHIRKRKTHKH